MHSTRRRILVLLIGLGVALLAPTAVRWWRAQQLLRALATTPPATADEVRTEEVTIPGRERPVRARLYFRADGVGDQALVVAHGVHYQGIDERRMVPFVRALARAGMFVLTPDPG